MLTDEELVGRYRKKFEELKRQVEFMRILLRESGVLEASVDVSVIDNLRQRLLTGFDKKKIAKTHSGENACRCCYYAYEVRFSPLNRADIAYLLIKNPDFQLPEPDWQFLKERNSISTGLGGYKCLLLGPRGCLYGKDRPAICLSFVCEGAVKAVLDKGSPRGGSFIAGSAKEEVLEKLGFEPGFNMREKTYDWYSEVLKPKMKQSEVGRLLEEVRNDFIRSSGVKKISDEIAKFFPGFTKEEIKEEIEYFCCA